ncbi:MAG: MarR family transcriptional regulator [Subdoligranulum variabile]|uniref:MarR family winged helix-turn-helix transcriptional regulator n=1 Tax=Gemmiger sp. TaxID=2049027 RepID=UPI002A7EFBE2|nr:MarR family transcriptional regulator [Gemmiger sp.]MCI6143198.1 MarR family transcriptional regulator [Subdoligranulum variabile]MCI7641849.1 MarR family transcriptional regulator [Subdoligranulum variabile]MDD6608689.1 MarR family transcriptional regulator [Subdoligranulum variabile]MDD6650332.1 MarR family transcriptional regulator [Subdoligranulum variabile]MDY4446754.1 MarR family transcriptional regulator [Gemmiger sp.]
MTTRNIKHLLDAFYQAKRVRELMPALPKGVTPAFIHYLDTIAALQQQGVRVKVSDISDALHIPRPGVTRTVKDMVDGGYLEKAASEEDGRVTYLTITEKGRMLSQVFDSAFFAQLTPLLADVSDEDAATTIRTIEKVYQVMSERRIHFEQ